MSMNAASATATPPKWAAERAALQERITQLEHQLAWFQRQLFGEKSERRHIDPAPGQMSLGEDLAPPPGGAPTSREIPAHQRRVVSKPAPDDEDGRLFFDEERLPVEVIAMPNPEIADLPEDAYSVIAEKVTHRLAQRPGSYVILKYVRQVIKRKDDQTLHCPPAPAAVLEGGRADVSFLAGLLVDKFLYHLPLYRQHQRLLAAGVDVSRQWLTNQVLAVALLLTPIVTAQSAAIRACRVKAMDETPIKAGRKGKGKLNNGYFWPVWGNTDDGGGDIVFLYRPSRAAIHVREGLGAKVGNEAVLITDGYAAYARYAERTGITHAQCWAHTRRTFERVKDIEPEAQAGPPPGPGHYRCAMARPRTPSPAPSVLRSSLHCPAYSPADADASSVGCSGQYLAWHRNAAGSGRLPRTLSPMPTIAPASFAPTSLSGS